VRGSMRAPPRRAANARQRECGEARGQRKEAYLCAVYEEAEMQVAIQQCAR